MTESLHLYLNSSACMLRLQGGWPWKRTVVQLEQASWQAYDVASLNLVMPAGGVRRGTGLHVLLGAALCKFLIVDIPVEVAEPTERALVAEARMRKQFGLALGEWEFTADTRSGVGQALVCAVRTVLIDRLRAQAAAHGLKLASARPYAGVLWDAVRAHRADGMETGLLAVEQDAFTVIMAHGRSIVAMHALQHGGEVDLVERELRRIGLSAGPAMRDAMWLAVPAHLTAPADFTRKRLLRSLRDGPAKMTTTFQDLLVAAKDMT